VQASMLQTLIDIWMQVLVYIKRECILDLYPELIAWGHGYQVPHDQFHDEFPD
jgi:hypothetical protein